MPAPRLDGAGQARMATLEEATSLHQRIHGLVEQYALSVQRRHPASHLIMNLKRQLPALAGLLKGQFEGIADLVTSTTVLMLRSSSEQVRVRQMREGMATIKTHLELAAAHTIAKHEIKDGKAPPGEDL